MNALNAALAKLTDLVLAPFSALPSQVALIVISTLVDYGTGLGLGRTRSPRARRLLLGGSLLVPVKGLFIEFRFVKNKGQRRLCGCIALLCRLFKQSHAFNQVALSVFFNSSLAIQFGIRMAEGGYQS